MNWREARQTKKGRTIDNVCHDWLNSEIPDVIKWRADDATKPAVSRSTLSRLERGMPTELTVFALAHLAALLGHRLSEIDPHAAETYRVLTDQAALIATWETARAAHQMQFRNLAISA